MISNECPKFVCMTLIHFNDISIFKNISLKKKYKLLCCSHHSTNIYLLFYKIINVINQILEFQRTQDM